MTAGILVCAMAFDAVLGEPKWIWSRLSHPAVLMGKTVNWFDKRFNKGPDQKLEGTKAVVLLVLAAIAAGLILSVFGPVVECILVAVLLAQRSLVEHVRSVADALRLSVEDGRMMVRRIVSRDTRDMDQSDVARAAIESAAENLSDGVIAPAFWFLLGGLPGIFVYKVINTADSMIGYRTEKYEDFGWAAARLDDALNWVPARLTGLIMSAMSKDVLALGAIRDDARLHKSPNAGWPEAAMARALNVALAGPRSYDGERRMLPFVFEDGAHDIGPDDIDAAIAVLWRTWTAALVGCILIAIF